MSERPQTPLTDRTIRESLAERDAPDQPRPINLGLCARDAAAVRAGILGRPALLPVFAGGRRLLFAFVLVALLVALGVAALLGSRPSRLSVVPPSPSPLVTIAPSTGPVLPVGWSHVADAPRIDFDGVGPEMDGLLVL